MKHLTPTVRRWVYSLALAALPVLVYYGLVEPAAAPLWLAFVLALVNVREEVPPRLAKVLSVHRRIKRNGG